MLEKAQVKWDYNNNQAANVPGFWSKFFTPEIVLTCVFGFLFGHASINGLYPFGLSFVAAMALGKNNTLMAGIFSLLGVSTAIRNYTVLRYFAAIVIFYIAYILSDKLFDNKKIQIGFVVFISNSLVGFTFLLIRGFSLYNILLLLIESSLSCIMAYIIPCGLPWLFKQHTQRAERNVCFIILAGVFLSIVNSFELYGINIRDVLGIFAILMMAYINGAGAGAAAGIIIGITSPALILTPWSISVLSFSGLIAGTFSNFGKIGVTMGFSLGYLIYNMYINAIFNIRTVLPVLIISSGMLLLLPKSITDNIKKYLVESGDLLSENTIIEEIVKDKLCNLALVFENMSKVFYKMISQEGQTLYKRYIENVCMEAEEKVCSTCGLCRVCWEKEKKRTFEAFYELIKIYESSPDLSILPHHFKARCNKVNEIKRIVKDQNYVYHLEKQLNTIVACSKKVLCDNFEQAADLVKTFANELYLEGYDYDLEMELKEEFSRLGIHVDKILMGSDQQKFEIIFVKSPCIGERQCETKIPKAITKLFDTKFNITALDCPLKSGSSKCRVHAIAPAVYNVIVGAAGIAKDKCNISGDGYSILELKNGKFLLALSDGMGVGAKAAKHSEMTLSILERLLEAGFDSDTALRIANSVLLIYTKEESFSTADLALIDMHTCNVEFVKAGAATGFVKRGSNVEIISGGSLPMGIVDKMSPQIKRKKLSPGDMIVMVTDGVLDCFSRNDNGEKVLQKIISKIRTTNPQEVAETILRKSKENKPIKDDMTVLVARIWERPVHI